MLRRSSGIKNAFIAAACLTTAVFAEVDFWPAELSVGGAEEEATPSDTDSTAAALAAIVPPADSAQHLPAGDSTDIIVSSDVSLYQTFKARNRLDWEQRLSRGTFTQTADYLYQQLNTESRIQSLDFRGSVMRRDFLLPGLEAGIDWTPIVSYRRRQSGTMQASADIGPVVNHSLLSIPYTVRGGLYGYASGDSIGSLSATPPDVFQSDPGLYAGCTLGNPDSAIGSLPMFVSLDAQGRSIKGNNLGLFAGSVLYSGEIPLLHGSDSLFIHVGDSITNGKELFIGDFAGASLFSNTSWRINHSFSGAIGIKARRRLGVSPQAYYRYVRHSITYPTKSQALDDIRTTRNVLGFALQSQDSLPFTYSGGIEFVGEFEDWLYRHSFGKTEVERDGNRDSLIVNQSDHYSAIVRSGNEFRLKLPGRFSAKYHLSAFKDSKRYPFVFYAVDYSDTLKNQNENDRVQIDQRISLRYERDSLFFIEAYGNYENLYHYYYRKERSAESRRTQEYRIGLNCRYSTGIFDFSEHVYGDAEVSDYYFKRVGKPPSYARDVTSTFSGRWQIIEDRFRLVGTWKEIYHDDGSWYGKAYLPDSGITGSDYYAVERKGTQYWLDFSLEGMFGFFKVTPGCLLHDVFQRSFDQNTRKYAVSSLDLGYDIEPYVLLVMQTEDLQLKLRIKRIINTQDSRQWDTGRNWDLLLQLQKVF